MNNTKWKKIQYQTESNKFYTLFKKDGFNKEEGVDLNPYKKNNRDRMIVVIQEQEVESLICFNIRHIEFGLFLEVYTLNRDEKFIMAEPLELDEILILIRKLKQFSFDAAIRYLKYKYGSREEYLFY